MATLSNSDYKNWIEDKEEIIFVEDDSEDVKAPEIDEIILSDADIIRALKKELRKVQKQLLKKHKEAKRLNKRNEILVDIMRGKHVKKQ